MEDSGEDLGSTNLYFIHAVFVRQIGDLHVSLGLHSRLRGTCQKQCSVISSEGKAVCSGALLLPRSPFFWPFQLTLFTLRKCDAPDTPNLPPPEKMSFLTEFFGTKCVITVWDQDLREFCQGRLWVNSQYSQFC